MVGRVSAPFHQLAVALSHTDQSYGRIGRGSQGTPRTRRPCLRLDLEGTSRPLRGVRHLDVSPEITEIADISARYIVSAHKSLDPGAGAGFLAARRPCVACGCLRPSPSCRLVLNFQHMTRRHTVGRGLRPRRNAKPTNLRCKIVADRPECDPYQTVSCHNISSPHL